MRSCLEKRVVKMTPRIRKVGLTAHITTSVGWLGAVTGFLALAIAGLTSEEPQMVRAAYLSMNLTTWFVIIPLSLAAPATGLIQSLGTSWGLFRHYWVLVKLVITIPATLLLLVHVQPIGHLARVVSDATIARGELGGLRIQLVADAGAALVVLLVATTLSVFKPWGRTRYGRRVQHELRLAAQPSMDVAPSDRIERADSPVANVRRRPGVYVAWLIALLLGVLVVLRHLSGGGLGRHGP
jgi:hypothetical protein